MNDQKKDFPNLLPSEMKLMKRKNYENKYSLDGALRDYSVNSRENETIERYDQVSIFIYKYSICSTFLIFFSFVYFMFIYWLTYFILDITQQMSIIILIITYNL